jgi:glucose-1-phosphate thymidylyltransferase
LAFRTWLNVHYPKRKITIIDNGVELVDDRLGAIGDLAFSLKKLNWQDDLLVLSSDTLTSLNFTDFINFFGKNRGVVNSVYDTHDLEIIRKKLGCVTVSGVEIIKFDEKPEKPATTLTSIPFYIYPQEVIPLIDKYIKAGGNVDAPGSIISWLVGKSKCIAYQVDGYYYDVGTIDVYNRLATTGI